MNYAARKRPTTLRQSVAGQRRVNRVSWFPWCVSIALQPQIQLQQPLEATTPENQPLTADIPQYLPYKDQIS
jgi:hypothetical protein